MRRRRMIFLLHTNFITRPGVRLFSCWFAGLSLGLLAAFVSEGLDESQVCGLALALPEFGGIVVCTTIPLLCSSYLAWLLGDAGCYGMCLLRGGLQGYFLGLIGLSWSLGTPLMVFLLGFTGFGVNGTLLVFWLRRLALGRQYFWQDSILALGSATAIVLVDQLVIVPLLAEIINF